MSEATWTGPQLVERINELVEQQGGFSVTDPQTGHRMSSVNPVTLTLASPPEDWPPVVRFDFHVDGRHESWDVDWGYADLTVDAAANLFLSVMFGNLTERDYI